MSQAKELQFTPLNHGALKVFGKLVHEWMNDPASNSNLVSMGEGRFKMSVENFRKALMKENLAQSASGDAEPDFLIRSDVKEIELVTRRPEVFEVLLPEPNMMLESGDDLKIPSVYGLVDYSNLGPLQESSPAFVKYKAPAGDLDAFLHPYMAAYMCSQCA